MKRNYLIIMRNGESVKRVYKTTSVPLTVCYDTVMWLQANDMRISNLIEQGYWLDTII